MLCHLIHHHVGSYMLCQVKQHGMAMKKPTAAAQASIGPVYPLQDVVGIIGIPVALATNWSRRYPDTAIEHSGRGRGRRRMVGAELIIRFSLMKVLTDVGIPPHDALGIAQAILREIAETKKHSAFTISYYPSGEAIALPEHAAAAPGAEATLRIDVRRIIDRVRRALAALPEQQPELRNS
jgi:hypothetical protein